MKQMLYKLTTHIIAQSDWWKQYINGSPFDARFTRSRHKDSPVGIWLYTNINNGKQIRMYDKHMVLDITKEEEILLRINKFYSKCKTTRHWSTE